MQKISLIFFILLNVFFFILSFKFPLMIYGTLILAGGFISFKAIQELYDFEFGTEFFLLIATVIGIIGHEEWATSIILLIMLIAYFIEELIQEKTDSSIESIISLIPNETTLKFDNIEKIVRTDDLKIGDIIIVKTGATIPVDGIIVEGNALVNNASLTGESTLESKKIGDKVFAATFVESGSILIKVDVIGKNTFFGKIKNLIEVAENNKPKILLLTDKITKYLVPTILLFIFIVWLLTRDTSLVMTLLVFGSPLELVLIIPLALLASIIAGFKNGIIIKSGKAIELLSQSNVFMFDKTGTLTTGDLKIVDIISLNDIYSKEDLLKIAAIAEKRSLHPIAKAIIKEANKENINIPDPDKYLNISEGIKIIYKGIEYNIGRFNSPKNSQYTEFDILENINPIGKIILEDSIRIQAKKVIEELNRLNIDTYLITGDNEGAAIRISKKLPINHIYSNLLPDEKLNIIKKIQDKKNIVTMIGDGINDAPALKQANVGIAMGTMGMEPAINASDIVLLSDNLEKLIFAYKLSVKTMSLIKQTIFIGFFISHITGMILAIFKIITPVQAALIHALLDILFLINNARLIYFKNK